MKKIITLLAVLAQFSLSPFASICHAANNNSADDRQAVYISDDLKIVPVVQREKNAQYHSTINASFPQISATTITPHTKEFNRVIRKAALSQIQQFNNYVREDYSHLQTLPLELQNNSLRMDYDINILQPGNAALVSVRLAVQGMQAGHAHPYHNFVSINFDLNTGKVLTLKSLFRHHAKYLELFSGYANQRLAAKLHDRWMIDSGTRPKLKNFAVWNIQTTGILITFPEYQVAPYVYGAQEVEVPYELLQDMLLPTSPVIACANNSDSCLE
jgi:hypothetical protein